jgi:uncharacterized membrane protein
MKIYIDKMWNRYYYVLLFVAVSLLIIFNSFPHFTYAGQFVIIVFHEFSHALTAWLFGYPAIPTFNLEGGLTVQMERSAIVSAVIFAAAAFIPVKLYVKYKKLPLKALFFIFIYIIIFFNTQANKGIIAFMGHAGEVLFALFFCYMGLGAFSGRRKAEKFVYFTLGAHFALNGVLFARSLQADQYQLHRYSNPESGIANDFTVIANASGQPVELFAALLLVLLAICCGVLLYFLSLRYNPFMRFAVQLREIFEA